MFLRTIAFGAIGLFAIASVAASDSYTIDPNHTFPSFEVNHVGFSTQRGRFNTTSGSITLDRATQKVEVNITIDANSIDTGFDKLEEHLRKPDFFDVAKFPTIVFKSNSGRFEGDKLVALEGQLTMHGETKPVLLQVHNFKCGNHPFTKKPLCSADVTGEIKRTDFGIKYGVPFVGDDVKLFIQVEALKNV
jgi:polyisoprenoid-binding protein YceI